MGVVGAMGVVGTVGVVGALGVVGGCRCGSEEAVVVGVIIVAGNPNSPQTAVHAIRIASTAAMDLIHGNRFF